MEVRETSFSLLGIVPLHCIGRYRLAVRIGISVHDALFGKRFLRRDIAIVAVWERNVDFTQENLARRSHRCCNHNQNREITNG